ncbi:hypothetical protein [Schaalia odontolytica]|nr:hypothetical protein [Schaalia odontolytica]WMS28044.1 hypothetical protein RDV55_03185 [Schaalia odontolytica]
MPRILIDEAGAGCGGLIGALGVCGAMVPEPDGTSDDQERTS